jgi:site-specific DNA-methyltransferase (adenine-specific)
MKVTDRIQITNEDNMELMARYPDKYFDLAIVDPPYGIGADENAFKNGVNCKANGFKEHKKGTWDNVIPTKEYFNELKRVSKNQIIWGGNYFTQYLEPVMSWIVWDKMQYNFSFSHGEMAWNSFNTKLLIFRYARGNESGFAPKIKQGMKQGLNIHPTQKPIALYKYCLETFAKQGDKILDTHLGSGSIALACHDYGFELTACELDLEYYDAAIKRINNHVSQTKLFAL